MIVHSTGFGQVIDKTLTPLQEKSEPAPSDPGAASANGPVIQAPEPSAS